MLPAEPKRASDPRFNEAAGIHRRKVVDVAGRRHSGGHASMRPPEFTGGKTTILVRTTGIPVGFNEAAGIHRRKGKRPWGRDYSHFKPLQ